MNFSFWNSLVSAYEGITTTVRNVTSAFTGGLAIFPSYIQVACNVLLILTVFFTVLAIIKHILDAIPFL